MPIICKYYLKLDDHRLQCTLCSHYCVLDSGEYGKCKVRMNSAGELISLNYAAVTGAAIDPIEKKPLHNYLPGANVFSFGCYGCNFRCLNCQNYGISDAEIFDIKRIIADNSNIIPPEIIVQNAVNHHCEGIAYTYSEPTVFWEYCEDIIKIAKLNVPEMKHILVTNGFFSRELLKDIIENRYIDAMNIDLKFMNEHYTDICGASAKPVLNNIREIAKNSSIHLEITNLVIPNLNDDDSDFRKLCEFIYELSPMIPLHFSKFFPTYKLNKTQSTDENVLLRAKEIAEEIGLKYVYIGNTNLQDVSDTKCPNCSQIIIKRNHYSTEIVGTRKGDEIECQNCKKKIRIK